MRTSPACEESLITRTKPCSIGSELDGNSGTEWTPFVSLSGTADRFVRCPVGLDSRLSATIV